MFQPLCGYPQAVKIHKMEMTIETSVMWGHIDTSVQAVTKHVILTSHK